MRVIARWPFLARRPAGEFDGTLRNRAAVDRWLAGHGAGPISNRPSDSTDRPRQVYALRPDLRAAFPHAYLPPGRRGFFDWLFTHGKAEFELTDSEIVAFLMELDRDPSHGIADMYRVTPRWQREVPGGLTSAGWPRLLDRLRTAEGLSGDWLATAVWPGEPVRPGGINLIGHFRLPCGVGEEITRFAQGLEQIGVPVSRRDVPAFQLTPSCAGPRPDGMENHAVTFLKFGATVDLKAVYDRAALYPRPGVYRVAGWSWELETLPSEAVNQLDFVDEIWVPSRFVAGAAERIAGAKPVRVMTPAVPVPVAPVNPRARFDLDPTAFVILFAFDAGSVLERKNPFALVRAVREAFRRDDRVTLVLKVSNGRTYPAPMARLRDEVAAIGGRVLEGTFPRGETEALLAACDCYASLHRSEGFGFSLAEAMLLGKPTVATGYSGNLDFMTPSNGFLVDYRLVELESTVGPYPSGARWAEPDVGHAAAVLRTVFEDGDGARQIGLRARQELTPLLDPPNAAKGIAARLHEIANLRAKIAA